VAKVWMDAFLRSGRKIGRAAVDSDNDTVTIQFETKGAVDEVVQLAQFGLIQGVMFDIVGIEAIPGQSRLGESRD